jgi:hypothetical protein
VDVEQPTDIKVLQCTCGRCGHTRSFRRESQITVAQLELLRSCRCEDCHGEGVVLGFVTCAARHGPPLEPLPLEQDTRRSVGRTEADTYIQV